LILVSGYELSQLRLDASVHGRAISAAALRRRLCVLLVDGGRAMSGSKYRERPDNCPLCSEAVSGLDFHHWDYEDDTGCYLCEPCHIVVHGGSKWWHQATDRPGRSQTWEIDALQNLVNEHVKEHPDEATVPEIAERYNIPDDEAREFDILVDFALDEVGDERVAHTAANQEADQ